MLGTSWWSPHGEVVVKRPPAGTIPESPGSYQFKDAHGRVIYVGKASNLRQRLSNYFQAPRNLHPRTAQTRINTALLTVHLDTHAEQWFAHVVNAGLIAPLHRRNGVSSYLDVGGLPLGAVPGAQYQHLDQPLRDGDWLVLCSDGIIEAMNCDREIYGFERLQAHVSTSAAQTAAALVTTIMQDIEAFTGGADQHDDMTVVVIRIVAAGAAE